MQLRKLFVALPIALAASVISAPQALAFGNTTWTGGGSGCGSSSYNGYSTSQAQGDYIYAAYTGPSVIRTGCNYEGTDFYTYYKTLTTSSNWVYGYGTIYSRTNNAPSGGAHKGGIMGSTFGIRYT